MKQLFAFVFAALVGLALAYAAPSTAAPGQNGCVSEVVSCSSGSCSRAVPDGGAGVDAGVSLAFVQAYTVRVCGTAARPLAGAGTLKDYHCIMSNGICPEVIANAQSVTSTSICQEYPGFVMPVQYPSSDKMVWAASGVTITNWDAGAADTVTVTVCPAQ